MLGYHYTSYENYCKIKSEGMHPYIIYRDELLEFIGVAKTTGIWLWPKLPFGISHCGCIIHQVATKGTAEVVLLAVEYEIDDLLRVDDKNYIVLHHYGTIGGFLYHNGQDIGVIVTKHIAPGKIRHICTYNFGEGWGSYENIENKIPDIAYRT